MMQTSIESLRKDCTMMHKELVTAQNDLAI